MDDTPRTVEEEIPFKKAKREDEKFTSPISLPEEIAIKKSKLVNAL